MRPGQIYDVIKKIHTNECKHSGYRKTQEMVNRQYYGISRLMVQKYISLCPTCQTSQPQLTRPNLRPIVENNFLDRFQIDLIDMRHRPDGEYYYIGHTMDHFSKFHVLFALKSKCADEIATLVRERVLAYLGPPKIWHHGNFFLLN